MQNVIDMENITYNCKKRILEISNIYGCYVGSAFSSLDILVYLYTKHLNISKSTLDSEERDYFILSKGHAVSALYSLFVEMKWIDKENLKHDEFYQHPSSLIPGIEFHSGSLGHGLAVSSGIALDIVKNKKSNQVFTLLGDGELNEGSVWETLNIISHHKLLNLTIIIDRNKYQANYKTEELLSLEPLKEKFEAFNFHVIEIDGHNFKELNQSFNMKTDKPKVIIAHTKRGNGINSIESNWEKWFMKTTDQEYRSLINELERNNENEVW